MTGTEYRFVAGENEPRLDRFLQGEFETAETDFPVTRSFLKRLIETGAVADENGVVLLKSSEVPKPGRAVVVKIPELRTLSAEPENIPIEIVFETEDFAVVNKPKGLVTHPCETCPQHTLVNALLYRLTGLSGINGAARPGIVHRLDKDTSGLLVVAKNDAAHLSLQKQIADKTAERKYLAVLDRNLKEDSGKIEFPLGRDPANRLRMTFRADGRRAVTRFTVSERFGGFTLAEFVLETGRTHQIRAHARLIGHPITGDVLYGGSDKLKTEGQLLHAYALSFDDPRTGERRTFTADPPEAFRKIVAALRVAKSK